MKTHALLLILFGIIFIFVKTAMGTNTLEITDSQTNVNDTATITVNMVNDSAIVAFQIDIPLPAQLTYIDSSAILNPYRTVDHVLKAKILPGDTLRIFGYSLNNTPFTGNNGAIVAFKLLTGTIPGNYPLNMVNPMVGDTASTNLLTGSINGTATILGPNISLSTTSLNFNRVPLLDSADRWFTIHNTGNRDLNVQSITSDTLYFTVVGNTSFTILAGQSQNVTVRFHSVVKGTYNNHLTITSDDFDEPTRTVDMTVVAFPVNELHTGNMQLYSGDYGTLSFTMNNMEPIVSIQFDLNLPEPISFVKDSVFLSSRKANHVVSANMINSNTLRVVAYSENNSYFTGNDGIILQLGFNVEGRGGYYSIGISNVVLGDTVGVNGVSAYTGGSLHIAAADIAAVSSINFGNVSVVSSKTESLTIHNYGNDTLEINAITFSNSSFSTLQSLPLLINQGNSLPIEITFGNSTEGNHTGSMRIFSNDPDESPFTVNLSGYSYIPNYISVKDSMYSYGDTMFVDIEVDNLEPFTGFQFDLHHTDSLTCLINQIQLGPRASDHIIQAVRIDSITTRILSYSLSEANFTGNSGVIISIPFISDSAVYGSIPLSFDSVVLGNNNSENILWGINNEPIIIARPQEIILETGWNIFSLNVEPYYMNMDSILVHQMLDSNLVKVVDEEGGFIQYVPGIGWLNTIGDLTTKDGYYIKVDTTDTLFCDGNPVVSPTTIPLLTGWNIMGYPLVNVQDALQALQPLVNNGLLYKIIDEKGGFIQNIPGLGWLNTIGNLQPGEGYYIKVNHSTSLTLTESSSKSNFKISENEPLEYFKLIQGNSLYNPMNFVLKLENDSTGIITSGDELAVFDGDFCVGATVISVDNQAYVSMVASMNDDDIAATNGYIAGNNFHVEFWDSETGALYAHVVPINENNISVFQPLETYIGSLSTNALGIKQFNNKNMVLNIIVAPNPVINTLNIYYQLPNSGKSVIQIFDFSGNNITSDNYDNRKNGWNSAMINVNNFKSGIYIGEITCTTADGVFIKSFKFVKL